jgi:hypothetical protein
MALRQDEQEAFVIGGGEIFAVAVGKGRPYLSDPRPYRD